MRRRFLGAQQRCNSRTRKTRALFNMRPGVVVTRLSAREVRFGSLLRVVGALMPLWPLRVLVPSGAVWSSARQTANGGRIGAHWGHTDFLVQNHLEVAILNGISKFWHRNIRYQISKSPTKVDYPKNYRINLRSHIILSHQPINSIFDLQIPKIR